MPADPKTPLNVGYWLLALLALVWIQSTWQAARTVEPVPYSQFEQALSEGRVAEVTLQNVQVGAEALLGAGLTASKHGDAARPQAKAVTGAMAASDLPAECLA